MENKIVKLYFKLENELGKRYSEKIETIDAIMPKLYKKIKSSNLLVKRYLENFVSELNNIRSNYKKEKNKLKDYDKEDSLKIALDFLETHFKEEINKAKKIRTHKELTDIVENVRDDS